MSFTQAGEPHLAAPVEAQRFQIAQEALNNALRHASACAVSVELRADETGARLSVRDDGRGFQLDLPVV